MASWRVDSPGPVGSPRTTAMSAPGGSKGGANHLSAAGSAGVWATAPPPCTERSRAASSSIHVGRHLMAARPLYQGRLSLRTGRRLPDEREDIGVDGIG